MFVVEEVMDHNGCPLVSSRLQCDYTYTAYVHMGRVQYISICTEIIRMIHWKVSTKFTSLHE